jgi:hypothetical protein
MNRGLSFILFLSHFFYSLNVRIFTLFKYGLPYFDINKGWKSIVRSTIKQHSSDPQSFLGKGDLFFNFEGIGSGVWGLIRVMDEDNEIENLLFPDKALS